MFCNAMINSIYEYKNVTTTYSVQQNKVSQ